MTWQRPLRFSPTKLLPIGLVNRWPQLVNMTRPRLHFKTVVEDWQAICSQTEPDRLLDTFMRVVLARAAAENGHLHHFSKPVPSEQFAELLRRHVSVPGASHLALVK